MATAPTSSAELNVDQLVTLAYRLNGFGPHDPSAADLALGRQVLLVQLHELTNSGVVLRARERVEIATVAGQAYVDAPSDTLSVEDGGSIRDSAVTPSEFPVVTRPIAEYQALVVKSTAGQPTSVYPEQRSDGSFRLYLYPVPTSDYPTLIVQRTRHPRDVDTGTLTVDYDRKWHMTILTFLQSRIARSKGRRDLASELWGEYQFFLERAQDNETEHGGGQFMADPSPWG